MLNKVIIQGRLVDSPDLRATQSGASFAKFTVAVERNRKNTSGTKDTDFIDCVAWRNVADFMSKYFHKGDGITVEGAINVRKYTDNEGKNRRAFEVNAVDVYFPVGARKTDSANFADTDDGGDNPFESMDDEGIPF